VYFVSPFQIVNQLVSFIKLGTNLMPLLATAATFGQDRTAVGIFSTMVVTVADLVVSFVRKNG
jgi:hypothetical protein